MNGIESDLNDLPNSRSAWEVSRLRAGFWQDRSILFDIVVSSKRGAAEFSRGGNVESRNPESSVDSTEVASMLPEESAGRSGPSDANKPTESFTGSRSLAFE